MYNLSQQLHFVGIGGVGMAGIAEVLLALGYRVSGSDLREGVLTHHLSELGAQVFIGHNPANIPAQTTVVVVSSAIQPTNPEYQAAQARKIPIIPRAEMLAELMRMKYGVAIAGSHGKTTTTSMTAKILGDAGLDPTVIVGGRLLSHASGARAGAGEYLVAEADESDGSFCLLRPAVAVVTNIDEEHLAHYGSFGALELAFASFMSSVPFYGLVVACLDDPVVTAIVGRLKRRVRTYGFGPGCDVSATEVEVGRGRTSYTLNVSGLRIGRFSVPVPGAHMVSNALAAIAVGGEFGVAPERCAVFLEDFPGVARRSELLAQNAGITVIDDYAHHPREVSATLKGIRASYLPSGAGRLIVLFQPHRFSRTKELFSDFVTAFGDADEVVVGDIYPAGEEALPGITGEKLAQSMQHAAVSFQGDLQVFVQNLAQRLSPGDVVVSLGAGSVTNAGHRLAELVRELTAG